MAIPPGSLKLYYDFGNPSCYSGSGNTVYDLSGNGYTGTLYGSWTYSSTGGSYIAGSLNDYLYYPTDSFPNNDSSSFSFSLWFKRDSLSITAQGFDIYFGFGEPVGVKDTLFLSSSATAYQTLLARGSNPLVTAGTLSTSWVNIFTTYDAATDTGQIYYNGAIGGTSVANANFKKINNYSTNIGMLNGLIDSSGPVSGGPYNRYSGMNGSYAILRVYNNHISSADVLSLYNSESNRFNPPPSPPAAVGSGRQFGEGFNG